MADLICSYNEQQVADFKSIGAGRLSALISMRRGIMIASCKLIFREHQPFLLIEKCYLRTMHSHSKWCAALMMSAVIAGRSICLCHFCSNIS